MIYYIKTDKDKKIVERYVSFEEEVPKGYIEITEEQNAQIIDLLDHQYEYVNGKIKEIGNGDNRI